MKTALLIVISLGLFLTGCATTGSQQQDIQIQQLQARVNYLETELQGKDQQIDNLEKELQGAHEIVIAAQKEKRQTERQIFSSRLSRKQIQRALKNAGFYTGAIDGKIGPQTKKAIKEFQKANGLKPDGFVGRRTREQLRKYL
jgi:peptidoglycan hydrolase-like protein with peptidoglycan-binding domain